MAPHKVALVGLGKIAHDQHIPAIAGNPDFELAAVVSRNATLEGVDCFTSLEAMLEARPDIDVVSHCQPPQPRFAMAATTIAAGRHTLLEKPPGATVAEVETLKGLAADKGVVLMTTWHSRHAAAVEPARQWLAGKRIARIEIAWREDVRRWHPGQAWIWEPGGLGVFDPVSNGLSILTAILPDPVHVTGAVLDFPENCQTPIAGRVQFTDAHGTPISGDFDWLQTGPQSWDITVWTDGGQLALSSGGAKMAVDGEIRVEAGDAEYPGIYEKAAGLLADGQSDVDAAPLQLIADAFLLGERRIVARFED
ncbi:Gfo/Idh/MocA family protein [Pelagibacterium montanilacus]|uniref:Gfo/Idh/MocA family protein n=1 Tax=Pelagibacterium montanilacus TaxID=2185280 RepID=UPI000F8C9354|nr:Gfo/Idh/MocA family oxidoreductase [Pelagibacterium montanilacus]